MRLIVARCEVRYSGRLEALLPEALRLLMIKSDGSVMVHADTGGFKPQNWMTPPTVLEFERANEPAVDEDQRTVPDPDGPALTKIVVRKRAGSTEDRLDIRIVEVLSDVLHDMGEAAALEKSGVERELQELLADAPEHCGEGFRLVRREWPTDIGPVDLMCRDGDDGWVAVEIKRVGTIEAVEQLTRYLERLREDPGMGEIRGVLAAQQIKPQARTLAESRGLAWVEVDLAVLRGEREPALTLFDV
ncbi:endonuclease NucS [Patulibacter defluvii]|uniref:endonuclease NucS n=1 Tax=Patulibacter defluvii TaxID=3095358 RepID=UPI002A74C326|nr:endonuclease NucS [Patulibacter sp. DM4]